MEYSYTIAPIPFPVLHRHVDQYATLRLLALRTNPEGFSSTYQHEKTNTFEQWRERINRPDRITLIAVASKDPANTPSLEDSEWVGILGILTPEFFKNEWDTLPLDFQQKFAMWSGTSTHILISMWVHPEHRRKGLGRNLISQAVEWVKHRDLPAESKGSSIVLEVTKANVGVATLYREMGFVDIEEVDDSIWMQRSL